MDYRESRAYIKEAEIYGSVLGLDNMRELMACLGNPQDTLKFIHVAGTNGKGSVIAYLYTVLTEAGFCVGRYISPAIYSYRERMECNGRKITRQSFAKHLTKVARAIETMTLRGLPHPTPFEIETAAAFLYFAEEKCDLVLLEVGLGGSLDATNIIGTPAVSVITSISMDHTAFLGNTLAEIAEKKAGIVKPGQTVVSVRQHPEVEAVLQKRCREQNAPLVTADASEAEILEESIAGQKFSYRGEIYELSLLGRCQIENAAAALCTLEVLDKLGYHTTKEQQKKGLLHTVWGGRFTVIQKDPLFIVDGAHNPGAAAQLVTSIETYLKGKNIYYIMGMFGDKDYENVIARTAPYAKKIYTIAAPGNARALSPRELAEAVSRYHSDVEAVESPEEAVKKALEGAEREDVILAFGSLAFLGDLSRAVQREKGACI